MAADFSAEQGKPKGDGISSCQHWKKIFANQELCSQWKYISKLKENKWINETHFQTKWIGECVMN
jgi:hypothetical protein